MSWFSKVVWSEGQFLRPHHFQQNDRHIARAIELRTRLASPYPWGVSALEIDADLAFQGQFGVRRLAGILPDGLAFDLPGDGPLPAAIGLDDAAQGKRLWLCLPASVPNAREFDRPDGEVASRFATGEETFRDSAADRQIEEAIEVAHPRLTLEVGARPKAGHTSIALARVLEIRDRRIIFDDKFIPPLLVCSASDTMTGFVDRISGWMEAQLEELARYAADPSAGGGFEDFDYFMLQVLNRTMPVLRHLRHSAYVHPERLYVELLRLAGELATFNGSSRRARDYPLYDHDDLETVLAPLMRDLQDLLSIRSNKRAIRIELQQGGASTPNAFVGLVRDPSLFRTANFVLEVGAHLSPADIQQQVPRLFKIGPTSRMNAILSNHLPGVPLVPVPTPPRQIRTVVGHVYFLLDKTSPYAYWPEFSKKPAFGLQYSGDWPGLDMTLWAIRGESP